MAEKVVLVDDLDGTVGAKTVHFGLDGHHYEIHLKPEHHEQLRDALGRFVAKGKKVTTTGTRRAPRGSVKAAVSADKAKLAAIREWAGHHGHKVAPRGRIPQIVIDAYNAAH